ncbi:hypothetical protein C8Q78DRAFT_136212 [Trametes maxima]|nr:hypothetical protein C8Q78DRAFT_136212 [Trametes maxima]
MEEGEILQPPQKASAAPTPLYPPGLFSPASPAAAAFPPTPTTVTKGIPGFDNSSFYGLSASATPFIFAPSQPANPTTLPAHDSTGDDDDGTTWQTFSRVAKKRPAQIPSEFKPLVKVLKRQLAEGTSRVESSQLGTLLSAEAAHLSTIYERAGVTRLKEYTALAAEMGIVTLSKERVDGHNYIALHPVHRRKAVEHVWG